MTDKSWHRPSVTPSRNVSGITSPKFDGAGTADIKHWIRHWEAVRDGRKRPDPGTEKMDPLAQIAECEAELEARRR